MKITTSGVLLKININDIDEDGHLQIPNDVKSISSWVCKHQIQIKTLYVPESITHIGNMTFYGCQELQVIEVHVNLVQIGLLSFTECPKLSTININAETNKDFERVKYRILSQSQGNLQSMELGCRSFATTQISR